MFVSNELVEPSDVIPLRNSAAFVSSPRNTLNKVSACLAVIYRGVINIRTWVGYAVGKVDGLVSSGSATANKCSGYFFTKMKHSLSMKCEVMPIQWGHERVSVATRKTISSADIENFKRSIHCNKSSPIPDESNHRGAIRVLSSYLEVLGLEIVPSAGDQATNGLQSFELKEKTTDKPDHTLTFDELKTLNRLLSNVLNGKGIAENQLSNRIHQAFAAVIKSGSLAKNQKKIYQALDVARGKISPSEVENETTFTVDGQTVTVKETLTAFKSSSWATGYCSLWQILNPCNWFRVSACKKNKELQTTAMNLQVHKTTVTIDGKPVTKTMIRGGAPCTHGMDPSTETLITALETRYSITSSSGESTYARASKLIKDYPNNEQVLALKQRMEYSTAQMLARLQAAYENRGSQHEDGPFIHSEMSFLSPGDKKEKSMLMDAEMAMENITKNYRISSDGSKVVYVAEGGNEGRAIQIILTQMGVNEKQISDDPMQDRINWQACQDLRVISGGSKEVIDLINLIEQRLQDPNRSYADADIVHWFNEIYEKLEITTGVFCKSGKDRTGQAVSDAVAETTRRALADQLPKKTRNCLQSMRDFARSGLGWNSKDPVEKLVRRTRRSMKHGLSLYVTGANTGKKNGYAFNLFQLSMLPKCFRPSRWICNTSAHS